MEAEEAPDKMRLRMWLPLWAMQCVGGLIVLNEEISTKLVGGRMKNAFALIGNPFVAIPLVLFGWYSYLAGANKSTFSLVFMVAFTLWVFLRIRHGLGRAAAAGNVVAAKATFLKLGEKDRSTVHDYSLEVIRRSGWRSANPPEFKNDAERFGWYALAMMEMGVLPLPIIPAWAVVKNPWFPIDDSQMETAIALAKKQGFEVSIDR